MRSDFAPLTSSNALGFFLQLPIFMPPQIITHPLEIVIPCLMKRNETVSLISYETWNNVLSYRKVKFFPPVHRWISSSCLPKLVFTSFCTDSKMHLEMFTWKLHHVNAYHNHHYCYHYCYLDDSLSLSSNVQITDCFSQELHILRPALTSALERLFWGSQNCSWKGIRISLN